MALKLWTSPYSWNCLRVELVLEEKGITEIERIPADLIGRKHKTPEFIDKSIYGKVPLLEDRDVVLFESRAICRYLCLKYPDAGPKLIPDLSDPKSKCIWEMRLVLEAIEFDVHISPITNEIITKPALKQTADEAVLARHQPKLESCLDVLDKALSKMPFLGGEEYSLVDVFYMPGLHAATRCWDVLEGRPDLKRWWDTVTAREAWKRAIQPLDDSWASAVPGWKSSVSSRHEEEGEGNRAHL